MPLSGDVAVSRVLAFVTDLIGDSDVAVTLLAERVAAASVGPVLVVRKPAETESDDAA